VASIVLLIVLRINSRSRKLILCEHKNSVCQNIGPAAAGSAGLVPTALMSSLRPRSWSRGASRTKSKVLTEKSQEFQDFC